MTDHDESRGGEAAAPGFSGIIDRINKGII